MNAVVERPGLRRWSRSFTIQNVVFEWVKSTLSDQYTGKVLCKCSPLKCYLTGKDLNVIMNVFDSWMFRPEALRVD